MTAVSQKEFAVLLGVNKGTVSRWKQAGRLVMSGGLVEVEASRQRLAETSGGRDDVSARHAQNRGAAIPAAGEAGKNAPEAAKVGAGKTAAPPVRNEVRADAQARKESAAADLLEIELAQKRGTLIPKEDVDASLKALGASVRARLDVLADQLAPVVAPVADLDETHAILAEHFRAVLAGISDDLARHEVTA